MACVELLLPFSCGDALYNANLRLLEQLLQIINEKRLYVKFVAVAGSGRSLQTLQQILSGIYYEAMLWGDVDIVLIPPVQKYDPLSKLTGLRTVIGRDEGKA